jgi:hypothetical protein
MSWWDDDGCVVSVLFGSKFESSRFYAKLGIAGMTLQVYGLNLTVRQIRPTVRYLPRYRNNGAHDALQVPREEYKMILWC